MTTRSTATFISYDLRPAKQSERRILIDLLKIGGDCGLDLSKYQYVGMGANRFYDFLLIHKYIGISKMVSLEHDPVMHSRAVFNVPYSFIDVRQESTDVFLASYQCADPTIFWFDYDGGLGEAITVDIESIGSRLKVGDFCFVTVFAGLPHFLEKKNGAERLAWLHDTLGPLSGDVTIDDVNRSTFKNAVHKVLLSSFKYAVAPRLDGIFVPLLQVSYADSQPMITVGGAFLLEDQAHLIRKKVSDSIPFLPLNSPQLYKIVSLHITDRERHLFDRAVTAAPTRKKERNQLIRLGFEEKEIKSYKDLVWYLPRYVETIV